MLARVNSINDTNYGAKEGEEIEHHLYDNERQGLKRFFDLEDIKYIFKDFDIQYVNEEIMTRYNRGDKKLYKICLKNRK